MEKYSEQRRGGEEEGWSFGMRLSCVMGMGRWEGQSGEMYKKYVCLQTSNCADALTAQTHAIQDKTTTIHTACKSKV